MINVEKELLLDKPLQKESLDDTDRQLYKLSVMIGDAKLFEDTTEVDMKKIIKDLEKLYTKILDDKHIASVEGK